MPEANFLQDLIAGTIGGVCGILVGQPADTVKVRVQTQSSGLYAGPTDCFKQILKQEGVSAFFKGVGAPILANAPINATIFVVYGGMVRWFNERHVSQEVSEHHANGHTLVRKPTSIQLRNRTLARDAEPVRLPPIYHFLAGSLGGLMQCVFACPNELIKIKQQLHTSNAVQSTVAIARDSVHASGLRKGLYQGWWLTCARDVPAFGIYFSSYEIFKVNLAKPSPSESLNVRAMDYHHQGFFGLGFGFGLGPQLASFFSGGIAGVLSFAFLHPIDVLKSCRQMHAGDMPAIETTPWAIAKMGYAQDGVRFFFRGLGPSVLRAGPVSAVIFVVYEEMLKLLQTT